MWLEESRTERGDKQKGPEREVVIAGKRKLRFGSHGLTGTRLLSGNEEVLVLLLAWLHEWA